MTDREREQIGYNYAAVRERIAQACRQAGRPESEVRLMAVSKTKPAEAIEAAADAGATLFGENRVQEMQQKAEVFTRRGLTCHMIGRLQTNKVKYLPALTGTIHSVDSERLAAEIDRQYAKHGKTARVLLEVNIGEQESKGGIAAAQVLPVARSLSSYAHLELAGLMCVPPICEGDEARRYFAQTRRLFERLRDEKLPGAKIEVLSMGMTGDYFEAVLEGSTLVRVGSAIFGAREYPAAQG